MEKRQFLERRNLGGFVGGLIERSNFSESAAEAWRTQTGPGLISTSGESVAEPVSDVEPIFRCLHWYTRRFSRAVLF
jgi:hypothetical protein